MFVGSFFGSKTSHFQAWSFSKVSAFGLSFSHSAWADLRNRDTSAAPGNSGANAAKPWRAMTGTWLLCCSKETPTKRYKKHDMSITNRKNMTHHDATDCRCLIGSFSLCLCLGFCFGSSLLRVGVGWNLPFLTLERLRAQAKQVGEGGTIHRNISKTCSWSN